MSQTIALITGVSRREGLGFATARFLSAQNVQVILTAREAAKADALAKEIGHSASSLVLDVTSDNSARAAAAEVESRHGRLDVLINNAAGAFDYQTPSRQVPMKDLKDALEIDFLGPLRIIQAFEPLLMKSAHPRIVNVSSEGASFGAPYPMAQRGPVLVAYACAKAALNALTVKLAAAYAGTPVMINSVCPGWIATYPGTAEMGARPVAEGAKSVAWAALLPDDGPRGGFFRDGQPLAW